MLADDTKEAALMMARIHDVNAAGMQKNNVVLDMLE